MTGYNFRLIRKKMNLRQDEFAELLEYNNRVSIARLEAFKKRNIPRATLRRLLTCKDERLKDLLSQYGV